MGPGYQSTSAERDRLRRILQHETYGPALTRLSKTGQREILVLISAGQTRQVRARLAELDLQRRTAVRDRSAIRRLEKRPGFHKAPGVKVTTDMVAAYRLMDSIMRPMGYNSAKWKARAEAMARADDLHALATMTEDEVGQHASMHARDADYSVFWYHYN